MCKISLSLTHAHTDAHMQTYRRAHALTLYQKTRNPLQFPGAQTRPRVHPQRELNLAKARLPPALPRGNFFQVPFIHYKHTPRGPAGNRAAAACLHPAMHACPRTSSSSSSFQAQCQRESPFRARGPLASEPGLCHEHAIQTFRALRWSV